jgi:hypothetical protein
VVWIELGERFERLTVARLVLPQAGLMESVHLLGSTANVAQLLRCRSLSSGPESNGL